MGMMGRSTWTGLARSAIATVLVWGLAIAAVAVLGAVLTAAISQGWPRLSLDFLRSAPSDAGRSGGIGPMIVSTGWIVALAIASAAPLSLASALWLEELARPNTWPLRLTNLSLDVLAGTPSIVFGLFGNAAFCQLLGLGFSILSGGLTLGCMVLPIAIRATQAGLRGVSAAERQAGAALGLSKTAILTRVVLPGALPAMAAGLLLGIGRAMAETAALIFTSGYVDRWPGTLWDSGRSLAVHIYDLAANVPGGEDNAYGTALVLVLLLLATNGGVMALVARSRSNATN